MVTKFETVCLVSDLTERGVAIGFAIDVDRFLNGFVVKFDGQPYAFINRCPHVRTELDWVPGVVFDEQKSFLSCATHGALFDPTTGVCIRGPCINQSLVALPVRVIGEEVCVAF